MLHFYIAYAIIDKMSANTNTAPLSYQIGEQYLEAVRADYRAGHGEYRGRRTEEQQLIAEVTSDEARLIVDGALLGLMAIGNLFAGKPAPESVGDDTVPIIGGRSWSDYRNEFTRSLVGIGVITNRLERDGRQIKSYADMPAEQRMEVACALFHDFNKLNALRFGTNTAGVKATEFKRIYTDEGGVETVQRTYDKDKAVNRKVIDRNIKVRDFATYPAAHPANKLSPLDYENLRREFPEMDKDKFDSDVSFYTNARQTFEDRE